VGAAIAQSDEKVMGRFLGAENVERGQAFLEDLDPELHRYVIEFVAARCARSLGGIGS
jgi:hypothetical protein